MNAGYHNALKAQISSIDAFLAVAVPGFAVHTLHFFKPSRTLSRTRWYYQTEENKMPQRARKYKE